MALNKASFVDVGVMAEALLMPDLSTPMSNKSRFGLVVDSSGVVWVGVCTLENCFKCGPGNACHLPSDPTPAALVGQGEPVVLPSRAKASLGLILGIMGPSRAG